MDAGRSGGGRDEMDGDRAFLELRRRQMGAFSRAQAMAEGISDKVLGRGCRARQVQRLHPGIYVDFTGPLPWQTRVWAAWLAYGPEAALTRDTALRWYGVDGDWGDDWIHIAVPHERRVDARRGIVVSRHRNLPAKLHGSREPPIVRLEVALLATASAEANLPRRVAVLLDACRQRRTTPQRLLTELDSLARLPGRHELRQILADAADGVQSFLEHAYLRHVERAHGLPTAERQVRVESGNGPARGRVVYRDARYTQYGVLVELDGQAGHSDSLSRWRDMARDNSASASGQLTLRFGYQLVSQPCAAAAQVLAALRLRGWTGRPHPCSPTCATPTTRAARFGEDFVPIREQLPPQTG